MLVADLLRCELCPAHLSQAIHAFPFPRFIGSNHSSKSLLELLSVCLLCGAENILRPSGKPSTLQPKPRRTRSLESRYPPRARYARRRARVLLQENQEQGGQAVAASE